MSERFQEIYDKVGRGLESQNFEKSADGLMFRNEDLKFLEHPVKSPVVVETVVKVVPGIYGKIEVYQSDNEISLAIVTSYPNATTNFEKFTADELRAAAKTFNDLASYLSSRY